MTLNCQEVPPLSYNCSHPWGPNCTSSTGFNFGSLWNYTLSILEACPEDPRLFKYGQGKSFWQNASLTQDACEAIAGSSWKVYPAIDIWQRLTTWKFPLLQLIFSFPRPPLNFTVESFVLLHLVGDPIDTTRSLLMKLSSCQQFAKHWQEILAHHGPCRSEDWKALALITDAYAEWARDLVIQDTLSQALAGVKGDKAAKDELLATVHQTAQALAADRSTKALVIIVAQAIFIATVGTSIFRTFSAAQTSDLNNQVFINVEAYSIAFTALYFWIIPTVILGSVIGVSQTCAAIPRILRRFQAELPKSIHLPNENLQELEIRIFNGGVYSWQPFKYSRKGADKSHDYLWEPFQHRPLSAELDDSLNLRPSWFGKSSIIPELKTQVHHTTYATVMVMLGTATAVIISNQVPPGGLNCRIAGHLAIFLIWFFSFLAGSCMKWIFLSQSSGSAQIKGREKLFRYTLIKDIFSTLSTTIGIMVTQIGVFNRCSCYTNWGRTGLALPYMPQVDKLLRQRIVGIYPIATFVGLGILLLIMPLYVCLKYRDAVRVYIQRDDSKSNTPRVLRKFQTRPDRRQPNDGINPGLDDAIKLDTIHLEAGIGDRSSRAPQSGDVTASKPNLSERPPDLIGDSSHEGRLTLEDDQIGKGKSTVKSIASGVASVHPQPRRWPLNPLEEPEPQVDETPFLLRYRSTH